MPDPAFSQHNLLRINLSESRWHPLPHHHHMSCGGASIWNCGLLCCACPSSCAHIPICESRAVKLDIARLCKKCLGREICSLIFAKPPRVRPVRFSGKRPSLGAGSMDALWIFWRWLKMRSCYGCGTRTGTGDLAWEPGSGSGPDFALCQKWLIKLCKVPVNPEVFPLFLRSAWSLNSISVVSPGIFLGKGEEKVPPQMTHIGLSWYLVA